MARPALRLLLVLALLPLARAARADVLTFAGGTGDWSSPASWSPQRTPAATDTVVVGSGTLVVNLSAVVRRVVLTGGTITGPNTLTVTGSLLWTGGTMAGTGTTVLDAGAAGTVEGPAAKTLKDRRLVVAGTLRRRSGPLVLDGATVENAGLFETAVDGEFGASGAFTNAGTFRKTAGAGAVSFSPYMTVLNAGTVEVRAGTVAVPGGDHTGRFTGLAGTTLRFAGGGALRGPVRTAGAVEFANGYAPLAVRDTLDVAEATTVSGFDLTVTGPVLGLGTLRSTFGAAAFNTHALTVGRVELAGGTLGGTSALTVTDRLVWTDGALAGPAPLTLAATATADLSDRGSKLLNRPFVNRGVVRFTGAGQLTLGGDLRFENAGLFEATGPTVLAGGDRARFLNAGTFRRAGDGATAFGDRLAFEQRGAAEVLAGRLTVSGGTSAGTYTTAAGATLSFGVPFTTHTFEAGTAFEGPGPLEFLATATFATDLAFDRPVRLAGTVQGPGALTFRGPAVWAGVELKPTGPLTVAEGGTLELAASGLRGLGLVNRGTVRLTAPGQFNWTGGMVDNAGVFEVDAAGIVNGTGTPAFRNLAGGTFRKLGAGDHRWQNVRFDNAGTVELEGGLFALDAAGVTVEPYRQTAGATVLDGGSFRSVQVNLFGGADANRPVRIEGGVLEGAGTITADLVNAATVRVGLGEGGTGVLTLAGRYTQTAAGTLALDLGGAAPGSGYDRLDARAADLAGRLALAQARGFAPGPTDLLQVVRYTQGVRQGAFTEVDGVAFADGVYLTTRYAATDLTVFNSLAQVVDVDLGIEGPGAARPGRPTRHVIRLRNNGDGTVVVPVEVILDPDAPRAEDQLKVWHDEFLAEAEELYRRYGLGTDAEAEELFSLLHPLVPYDEDDQGRYRMPYHVVLPPGAEIELPVTAGCGAGCVSVETGAPIDPVQFSKCLLDGSNFVLGLLPGADCVKLGVKIFADVAGPKKFSALNVAGSWLLGALKCATSLVPLKAAKVYTDVAKAVSLAKNGLGVFSSCGPLFDPSGSAASSGTACVTSADPNDKVGPAGFGPDRYLATLADTTLRYAVLFENKPTATAPAQTVVVTDTLDAARFDLATFALDAGTFGARTFPVPAGARSFQTDVDLRPAANLIARVEGGLDAATGVVTWRFTSLDPATMRPTEDALAGFLPPNGAAGEGEGLVTYTVRPRAGLATGTAFGAAARIVFDENAPIDTPVWRNTADRDAPESRVVRAGVAAAGNALDVVWRGSDAGAGLRTYAVYAATDGGPFALWLAATADTTARFEAAPGHTYAFYTVARDGVGLAEAAPAAPDLTYTYTVTDAGAAPAPAAFALAAPRPNPARDGAALGFALPAAADVTVAVYDVLGREVARPVAGPFAAGRHTARLDAGALAPGTYVVRVTAGRDVATRTLTVAR